MTRICVKCGLEKPIEHFHLRSKLSTRRNWKCAECSNKERAERYIKHKPEEDLRHKEMYHKDIIKSREEKKKSYNKTKHSLSSRYKDHKKRALLDNRVQELTKPKFGEITSQPCRYCGGTSTHKYNKSIVYAHVGVDRINPNEGYTVENSGPCCNNCNYGKLRMQEDEYVDHIKHQYEHLKSVGMIYA